MANLILSARRLAAIKLVAEQLHALPLTAQSKMSFKDFCDFYVADGHGAELIMRDGPGLVYEMIRRGARLGLTFDFETRGGELVCIARANITGFVPHPSPSFQTATV